MAIDDARAWVEVDLAALRANYDRVREAAGKTAAMVPMVKADGYGLGAERVVRALEPLGPWGFGVATAGEGEQLRRFGVTRPILVAGPLPPGDVDTAAAARLTVTIASLEGLEAWAAAAERVGGEPLHFHVEVDSGMGRSGFDWRDVGEWGPGIVERCGGRTRWTGCFTHFHSADATDPAPTERQWERFRSALVQLPVSPDDLLVHTSNSAAALRWPDYAGGAVRPGIFLYGGNPAPDVSELSPPSPVASVRARLVLVRDKRAGSTVGYGATHSAGDRERWGTLAIGYGDGLPRSLGGLGTALVRGRTVPIIGRISMDMTTVRLDGVPEAKVGDVVTLIGEDGDQRITVDDVAGLVGTISYEILTGLGQRLPRIETNGV